MNTKRYEKALETILPKSHTDWTEEHYAIMMAASEVDRVIERLTDDADRMAERFAKYATDIRGGYFFGPPTGYSTIHDITTAAARLEMAIDKLHTLIHCVFDFTTLKDYRAAVKGE